MEKAWNVCTARGLGEHPLPAGCSRLYFGSEFCQLLAPTARELEEAIAGAQERKAAFTLATPYLGEGKLGEWLSLARVLSERAPGSEIVLNDWGLWLSVKEEGLGLAPVLGRLLARQKKGPEILRVLEEVPPDVVEHFASAGAASRQFAGFLKEEGFGRVELDWPPLGLRSSFKGTGLKASLHHPWAHVTTTRLCPVSGCEDPRIAGRVTIPTACARECQRYTFELSHEWVPRKLVLKGNTQFLRAEKIPPAVELERLGIDRLVEAPEPPA